MFRKFAKPWRVQESHQWNLVYTDAAATYRRCVHPSYADTRVGSSITRHMEHVNKYKDGVSGWEHFRACLLAMSLLRQTDPDVEKLLVRVSDKNCAGRVLAAGSISWAARVTLCPQYAALVAEYKLDAVFRAL